MTTTLSRTSRPLQACQETPELRRLIDARATGDPGQCSAAEDAVIVAYLSVARGVANRYRQRRIDTDDLEQVARLGLIKAVHRWRPDRGPFMAYAIPTMDGEVKRHFRDARSIIRIPRQLYESQPRVTAAQRALRQENSREPSPAEIADRAGIPERQVRDINMASNIGQTWSTDDYDDLITGLSSVEAERSLAIVALRHTLRSALNCLSKREQRIIALRFIWGQSQVCIAAEIGVSQMQISRILNAALTKLREEIDPADSDIMPPMSA